MSKSEDNNVSKKRTTLRSFKNPSTRSGGNDNDDDDYDNDVTATPTTTTTLAVVNGNNNNSAKKQRASNNNNNNNNENAIAIAETIDLTGSDDDEEDDEERAAAGSTSNNNVTDVTAGDEALARQLQQQLDQEEQEQAVAPDELSAVAVPRVEDQVHALRQQQHYAWQQQRQQRQQPHAQQPHAALQNFHHDIGDDYDDDPCLDPTTVVTGGHFWIFKHGPEAYGSGGDINTHGKWLYYTSEKHVNAYWQAIWPKVVSGELHASAAKVSTKWGKKETGKNSHVIMVYSTADRIDEVGRKFFKFFRRDEINYKTNLATSKGERDTIEKLTWPLMTPEVSLSQALAAVAKPLQERQLTDEVHIIPLTMLGMKYNNVSPAQHEQLFRPGVTRVFLHREESNTHDEHAIRVDFCYPNQPPPPLQHNKKSKIGYIKMEQVELLSPWIDRGLVVIVNDDESGAKVDRLTSDSAIELSVKVRACRDAQEMLTAV